ncbi:amino acid adenylation domain-containing protein [Rhodobacterales bacterium HKCCE2091]|nr:amino acid adenylation domain-containing protein [Rhodobacterales bacterium HKCCE2091]
MIAADIDGIEEVLPLAPQQAGMLFDLLRGDAPPGTYVGLMRVTLDGAVDPVRLSAALRATTAAHDVFRLSFEWEGLKRPIQILHDGAGLPVTTEDGAGLDDAALDARIAAELDRGIDPRQAPLSRALILRRADGAVELAWVLHHLIADGWSAGLLLDEVLDRHDGGTPGPAPAFRDLLAWRANRPDSEIAADEAWWRRALSDLPAPVRPNIPAEPGATRGGPAITRLLPVDPATYRAVADLARRARSTPAQVLSALFALILRRYGCGDDVTVGETNAGRPADLPGADAAVGPYITTLPIRFRIDGAETVSAYLARAASEARDRRPHLLAPLSDLKAWSGLRSGAPLYHVPLIYEGLPPAASRASGVTVRSVDLGAPGTEGLAVLYLPGLRPALRLYVRPDIHDPDMAETFGRDFLALVHAATRAPEAPVSTLTRDLCPAPATTPAARTDFPPVTDAILAVAERAAGATAIRCGSATMSYGDLVETARCYAAGLSEAGIGPGDVVPVAIGRGPEAIAAMLGVLFRGAAYTVLDLDYPRDRLSAILVASGARAIVTRPGDEGTVDFSDLPRVGKADRGIAPVPVAPGDAAYVLFTSGSQGRPKGVRVTHGNLAYSTGIRTEVYGNDPRAFLVLSPLGFDSSVAGLYWALTTGGEVQLSPPGVERDATRLASLITRDGPSHMLCLPGLHDVLLDAVPAGALDTLDTVIVAGEALPGALVAKHRAEGRGRLFNEYGPTEATVWCTAFDTAGHDGGPDVPIGRALPGAVVAVTDPDGAPLPDGIPGEITVAGPGVADGYLGDPAAIARAFRGLGGLPAYRTGDIGIRRPDGILLYRGRADAQVKIRGHRVELAEVEAALGAIPGLGDRAVLPVEGPGGTRILAVCESGEAAAIRAALAERLPAWMVPAAIRVMRPLPRLPNGKIDRRRLADETAAPVSAVTGRPEGFVATTLAGIWSDLLGVADVRADADFFALGGDSLLAMRAVFAAEAAGLPLAAHEIFDRPVLFDLAAHVEARAASDPAAPAEGLVARLNPEGTAPPFLMIHGSPEMCAHLGHALGPDRPLAFGYSHFLRGPAPFGRTVPDMVAELAGTARDAFGDGPALIGGYSLGGVLAVELARVLRAETGRNPFVFLLDPSWETGASPMHPLRRAGLKARSAMLARMHDLRHRATGGEAARIASVGHCYRARLLGYAPRPYDGPVTLVTSREGAALRDPAGWLARTCPNRTDIALDVSHLDLQHDRDALFAWTTLLARHLHERERG